MNCTLNNPNKKQLSEIHLIRHGITEGNQKNWFYGAIDIPLADEGVKELTRLAEEKIHPCIDIASDEKLAPDFYTSGMLRTEQTFSIIYGDVAHKVIPDLREINFGIFEGYNHKELLGRPDYQAWLDMKGLDAAPPEGDNIRDFNDRVQRGFDTLCGYHRLKELSHRHSKLPCHSVVVCHGGVIAAILTTHFTSPDKKNFYDWIPDPGHGYSRTMEEGKPIAFRSF